MTRQLVLNRTEAEFLVDLLENPGPVIEPCWQGQYLADEIRELFGMRHASEEKGNILYNSREVYNRPFNILADGRGFFARNVAEEEGK